MVDKSIAAYDLPQRVASYDADMDVMHPNRVKMIEVALEILPFPPEAPLHALDIGVGTGYFSEQFLRRYPRAHIWAVDGAVAMVDLARSRLGSLAERTRFFIGDFRNLSRLLPEGQTFDVALSSFALHHLGKDHKQAVVRQARERLRPDGWFLNADILAAESPEIDRRIQDVRVSGIMKRAGAGDPRFPDARTTRAFLDRMQESEGDQPITLREELEVLRGAGFPAAAVLWLEYREAVCAARMSSA